MKEHITTATVEIKKIDDPEHPWNGHWHINVNGQTTGVSSGSMWGCGTSAPTYEEALAQAKEYVKNHNIWCDSYQGEDGKVHRLGEKYKTIFIVNGEKMPFDTESSLLTRWC